MNNSSRIKYSSNDEFYTPGILVEPIIEYIPEGATTIWCPFDTANSEFVLTLNDVPTSAS